MLCTKCVAKTKNTYKFTLVFIKVYNTHNKVHKIIV